MYTPEIKIRLDADEFLAALQEYKQVIEELSTAIENMQNNMHTLTNLLTGKVSATEAELIAKQVAKEVITEMRDKICI